MAKFAHLLVLATLIVWLAGSGCVGNNTSEVKEAGIAPDVAGEENGNSEAGLTPADVQELDSDMADLEELLENASLEEDIVIEEI